MHCSLSELALSRKKSQFMEKRFNLWARSQELNIPGEVEKETHFPQLPRDITSVPSEILLQNASPGTGIPFKFGQN